MKATSLSALALVLLASAAAHAEGPAPGSAGAGAELPHLNVAASVGMNSPAGLAGLEADYRIARYFSAGLAGGYGLWGARISPTVKLEIPFSASTGIFVEGALSLNTGGSGHTEINGVREDFEMGMVPAASVSVGGRVKKWGPFWTGARVGLNFALRDKAYEIMSGGEPSETTHDLLEAAYPGGLVVAAMAGASF
jgi:hypothetical protein